MQRMAIRHLHSASNFRGVRLSDPDVLPAIQDREASRGRGR